MESLKAAWLYPDTLYLHGERGNVLALRRLAENMGIDFSVDRIGLSEAFDPMEYDMIYVPAGELTRMEPVVRSLGPVRGRLAEFVEAGRPLLVTGTSVAYFGKSLMRSDKSEVKGLGLLGSTAWERESVYGDDLLFEAEYNGKRMRLVGNQIRMADLNLGGERPFGKLLYGYGNTGKDTAEGVAKANSVFTNALGPLLVLNPWLGAEMLNAALEAKGAEPVKADMDFELEEAGLASKTEYIRNKKTDLRNCGKLRQR